MLQEPRRSSQDTSRGCPRNAWTSGIVVFNGITWPTLDWLNGLALVVTDAGVRTTAAPDPGVPTSSAQIETGETGLAQLSVKASKTDPLRWLPRMFGLFGLFGLFGPVSLIVTRG